MVSTNAAVLPVPDCDCAIMFVGLWDIKAEISTGKVVQDTTILTDHGP